MYNTSVEKFAHVTTKREVNKDDSDRDSTTSSDDEFDGELVIEKSKISIVSKTIKKVKKDKKIKKPKKKSSKRKISSSSSN